MTLRIAAWCLITLAGIFLLAARGDAPTTQRAAADSQQLLHLQEDLVCGPRCVQYLLRFYGKKDEDLIGLVREIQWPGLEGGASLANLEQALHKRGIYTYGMRVPATATLQWPWPVLVHLKGETAGGHYVVWLPSSSPSEVRVWMGLDGVRSIAPKILSSRGSGPVLLTSPAPIKSPNAAVRNNVGLLSWFLALSPGITVSLVVVVLIVASKRRH